MAGQAPAESVVIFGTASVARSVQKAARIERCHPNSLSAGYAPESQQVVIRYECKYSGFDGHTLKCSSTGICMVCETISHLLKD